MQLCVSNIAWPTTEDDETHALLAASGVRLIELAPTRWWPDLSQVTADQTAECRARLERHGLRIAAFQAVLFGRPELGVFDAATREPCARYLEAVIELAARLGVTAIVFGSPKNRLRGRLSPAEAMAEATPFFRRLGDFAAARGVRFCFEPNPTAYGADFGRTFAEAAELVRAVDSPGFWLNVDGGALTLNAEDPVASFALAPTRLGHFHISEPFLGPYDAAKGNHRALAAALQSVAYDGVVSLEMRAQEDGLAAVARAIQFARAHYPC